MSSQGRNGLESPASGSTAGRWKVPLSVDESWRLSYPNDDRNLRRGSMRCRSISLHAKVPLIDGAGRIWQPHSTEPGALQSYTR